jgi:hypothetical protein
VVASSRNDLYDFEQYRDNWFEHRLQILTAVFGVATCNKPKPLQES